MTVSKAQQKATAKYVKNNYDRIEIKVSKGKKNVIETAAKEQNARYAADTGNNIEL